MHRVMAHLEQQDLICCAVFLEIVGYGISVIRVFAEDVGEEGLLVDICDRDVVLAAGGIFIYCLGLFVGYRVQEVGFVRVLMCFGA